MAKPVRKAVRTFLIYDNKVIIIKYLQGMNCGYYDIPGGKIENNESNYEASFREFKEETGLEILNQKLVGNVIVEYPEMIFDFDIFIANEYKGSLENFSENESMWFEINSLISQKKIFPSIELLKEDYMKYLKHGNFKIKLIVDNEHNILDKEICIIN